MLRIESLSARYGEAAVLREVSLWVGAGEVVTLCGRNGAGKTTLLRCVMGLHPISSGRIELLGQVLGALPAYRRARLGFGWVPDDRGVYASLTVAENLTLPRVVGPRPWPLGRVYEAFPLLYQRRGPRR
jgi:branched-chain amino acid transport system ATP-binding protein